MVLAVGVGGGVNVAVGVGVAVAVGLIVTVVVGVGVIAGVEVGVGRSHAMKVSSTLQPSPEPLESLPMRQHRAMVCPPKPS